jgi:hypothetical protein
MKKLSSVLIFIFLLFLVFYFGLPVLNYGFFQLPILAIIIVFVLLLMSMEFKTTNNGQGLLIKKQPNKILVYLLVILIVYATAVPFFTTAPILHTKKYQNLIGKVENGNEITKQIEAISIDEIRVVDRPLAYLLGEKILGSQPALGSQVELGDFFIQKVNGKLYWVAPLLYSGFFKWYASLFKSGIPNTPINSPTGVCVVAVIMTLLSSAIDSIVVASSAVTLSVAIKPSECVCDTMSCKMSFICFSNDYFYCII